MHENEIMYNFIKKLFNFFLQIYLYQKNYKFK